MPTETWFDDIPVIGNLSPEEAAAKLLEVGEEETAKSLTAPRKKVTTTPTDFGLREDLLPFLDKPWLYTQHIFGYVNPSNSEGTELLIEDACEIEADTTLINNPININLEQMGVAKYPGGGTHYILFDFQAQTQILDSRETLNINTTHRIKDGEVAIINQPIFAPLYVDAEGVDFRCLTVNVKNEEDERALSFLESPVFRSGLAAAATMSQLAIFPLSHLAIGLIKMVAKRSKNVPVQKFEMGLDVSDISERPRLAEGFYIAVQIPENYKNAWDWEDWVYNPETGQIVEDGDRTELIPYNYIVFSVSRYQVK
ncbi:MAG: hypothetical protein F6K54_28795 [Okeania sp. SIO3B5]|uniref:hypothetical protein n=1 Tax=Okeania sp. SIO3B5 TaxID=2607811 RepID=UPI0014014525|nr:hypothetical protein [Okeania sp. SIO3B5]NEO56723.1 hypothetical protein [Okeania sp. SIO3B5]